MVAKSSDFGVKAEKIPHQWLKPFQTEWTWRVVKGEEDSRAKAILSN